MQSRWILIIAAAFLSLAMAGTVGAVDLTGAATDKATDMAKDKATDMAKDQVMGGAGVDASGAVPSIPVGGDVSGMAEDAATDAAKDAATEQAKGLIK